MPVIPVLRRLRQEDCHEFGVQHGLHSELKVRLDYIARQSQQRKKERNGSISINLVEGPTEVFESIIYYLFVVY